MKVISVYIHTHTHTTAVLTTTGMEGHVCLTI